MSNPTLIIMAAGMGSRYGRLKQIDPVGPRGELIIEYSVYDALRAGFGKIIFVIKEAIERDFRSLIADSITQYCDTALVYQSLADVPEGIQVPIGRTKPWGTGQATLLCRDVVDGPFAVINADDFYGKNSFQLLHDYLITTGGMEESGKYCMIGYQLKNTLTEHGHVSRGVCRVDEGGNLVEIQERTHIKKFNETAKFTEDGGDTWVEIPMDNPVSMNMWGFSYDFFDELAEAFERFFQEAENLESDEFYLPVVVNSLLKEKQVWVKVLPTDERWAGITYQADRPVVEAYIRELIKRGVYPDNLWGGQPS